LYSGHIAISGSDQLVLYSFNQLIIIFLISYLGFYRLWARIGSESSDDLDFSDFICKQSEARSA
jgi:hypothetical protein